MTQLRIGTARRDTFRRLLRRVGTVFLLLSIGLALVYTAFRQWTGFRLPEDNGPVEPVAAIGPTGKLTAGNNAFYRDRGIWRLELAGNPRTLGHHRWLLTSHLWWDIDAHYGRMVRAFEPRGYRRWVSANRLRYRLRALPEQLPAKAVIELAAFARPLESLGGAQGSEGFKRVLYQNQLYEISQLVTQRPPWRSTSFALWDRRSIEGRFLVGRNFDVPDAPLLDRNKVFSIVRPEEGIPYAAVGWPGMLGVVSGVSAQRIFVAVHGAAADGDLVGDKTPVTWLARTILEKATSLKMATAMVKKSAPSVPFALFIADAATKKAIVIERSPTQFRVRRAKRSMLVATDHFLHKKYRADARNDHLRRSTGSEARFKRVEQLVQRFSGRFDAATMALVLRNRSGLNDAPLPLGNQAAIDAQATAHSLVVDMSQLVMWISKGPGTSGPYVAFDLKPAFGMPSDAAAAPADIPADNPTDTGSQVKGHLLKRMQYARSLAEKGYVDEALRVVDALAGSSSELPQLSLVKGDLHWHKGQRDKARSAYQQYLASQPCHGLARVRAERRVNR